MPDLLIELLSEEIPARMQPRAADDLRRLVTDGLVEAGLTYEGARGFATPRRLALTVQGLTAESPTTVEERRGPRTDAPDKALAGFLRATGVDRDRLERREDRKGAVWFARIERPGRPAAEIVAEVLEATIRGFPWPKSMRWGGPDDPGQGTLRWVRPLRSILCQLTDEAGSEVVEVEIAGLRAGDTTEGHPVMAPGRFRVSGFDDYVARLHRAHVILDPEARAAHIRADIENLAFAAGLSLVDDPGLLQEVAGLVEWPVALTGPIEAAFLDLPPEVLRTSMREHQKFFSLAAPAGTAGADVAAGPASGGVAAIGAAPGSDSPEGTGSAGGAGGAAAERTVAAPVAAADPGADAGAASSDGGTTAGGAGGTRIVRFATIADIAAEDDGAAILAGNRKVLAARLSDAEFFWQNDLAVAREGMTRWLEALGQVTFHARLGSQADRIARIAALAREIAPQVGADPDLAERAARFCKADLASEMVYEFPELQGTMGRYYALAAGEALEVAAAAEAHYRPVGPSDAVPTEPVGVAVALADKIDTLTAFWAIDETPTGSRDPFALRRAALGVIRIVLETGLRAPLLPVARTHLRMLGSGPVLVSGAESAGGKPVADMTADRLLDFIHDRLKVYLRDRGVRHDVIDACLATGQADDLALLVARAEALQAVLATPDGENLVLGFRRAANILAQAEAADGVEYSFGAEPKLAETAEETALFEALDRQGAEIDAALARDDFAAAVAAMAALRAPVDAFFEAVQINTDNQVIRRNRLNLLSQIRATCLRAADLSRLQE